MKIIDEFFANGEKQCRACGGQNEMIEVLCTCPEHTFKPDKQRHWVCNNPACTQYPEGRAFYYEDDI